MSNVIKPRPGRVSSSVDVEVRPADLGDLFPAQQIDPVDRARREADEIVRKAREEAQSITERAREDGYSAGMEQGLKQGMESVDELASRLEEDLAQLQQDREAVLDAVEPEVLKLCVETVEKIIRHEVRTNPRIVIRTIKSLLRRVKDATEVYLRVSPQEVDAVRAQREELMAVAEGLRSINIADDRRISPGGCVLEAPTGDFDACIETQIDQVKKKLVETYEDDRRDKCAEPDEVSPEDRADGYGPA